MCIVAVVRTPAIQAFAHFPMSPQLSKNAWNVITLCNPIASITLCNPVVSIAWWNIVQIWCNPMISNILQCCRSWNLMKGSSIVLTSKPLNKVSKCLLVIGTSGMTSLVIFDMNLYKSGWNITFICFHILHQLHLGMNVIVGARKLSARPGALVVLSTQPY